MRHALELWASEGAHTCAASTYSATNRRHDKTAISFLPVPSAHNFLQVMLLFCSSLTYHAQSNGDVSYSSTPMIRR